MPPTDTNTGMPASRVFCTWRQMRSLARALPPPLLMRLLLQRDKLCLVGMIKTSVGITISLSHQYGVEEFSRFH